MRCGADFRVLIFENFCSKTSSVYQHWFKQVLQEALGEQFNGPMDELPDGADSFFRQLDYMMATLANKDFARLYKVQDIKDYASLKDGIFQRYRCVVCNMWYVVCNIWYVVCNMQYVT